jgi:hypothetical protein
VTRDEIKARWPVCGRCRHPGPLHSSNGEPGPCLAQGCHGGPDNEPCPGFITEAEWKIRQEAVPVEKERDPRMASAQAQARAAELRERIEAEMTEERRAMLIRAGLGAAALITVAVIIRAVRKRAQDG